MKLSLSWIFDHIDARWQDQDIKTIMARFNAVTAEIESYEQVAFPLDQFALGLVIKRGEQTVSLKVTEWGSEAELPVRNDLNGSDESMSQVFMVRRQGREVFWATLADFGLDKPGLMPAIDATQAALFLAGGWKEQFESKDVIIEVDNKSITHRPDMWGHRGFAREIAAFLGLELRAPETFLSSVPVTVVEKGFAKSTSIPFEIINKAPQGCSRFTALYFSSIRQQPSNLFVASRLLKVGVRPMNGLVDLGNYVMLDWSQPVHLYDADKIKGEQVAVRMATAGERLKLLDGTQAELTDQDLVIADQSGPMCLAGIMGGIDSGVSNQTKSVVLESATFDAGLVRKSSLRHKARTDSSARFEKTLDPNQTVQAAQRFVKLLETYRVKATHAQQIVLLGMDVAPVAIQVSHEFLEQRAGIKFSQDDIVRPLTRLGFGVEASGGTYAITIPSFRASKDIKIKEDILEEVVRCFGFGKIQPVLPSMVRVPFDTTMITRTRALKNFLAFGAQMIEQYNYAFFDEQFIASLGLEPEVAARIVNPVSENSCRLVTSLVPGLLKNIKDNHVQRDYLAFFELGRVWNPGSKHGEVVEQQQVAGIFFEKRTTLDFYQAKQTLETVVASLGFARSAIAWKKEPITGGQPWYLGHQTASLYVQGQWVGRLGKIDPALMGKLDLGIQADACIFELEADVLLQTQIPVVAYQSVSKFQESFIDLSVLAPLQVTCQQLEQALLGVDELVKKVELIDFFEKSDWHDVRSLTFRSWMWHQDKTLEKAELDDIWKKSVAVLEGFGAKLRV